MNTINTDHPYKATAPLQEQPQKQPYVAPALEHLGDYSARIGQGPVVSLPVNP